MKKKTMNMIVAISGEKRVMGKNGSIPWQIPEDLQYFKKITSGSIVIMGRKTWESLPSQYRPLPDRENIVLTRDTDFNALGAVVVHSKEEALQKVDSSANKDIFIIGGSAIYEMFLPDTEKLFITQIKKDFDGDIYFPSYEDMFSLTKETPGEKVIFKEFKRK